MTKLTATEAELREWIAQGKTHLDIAAMLGRHHTAVACACALLGISRNGGKRGIARKGGTNDEYIAGLRLGKTIREIADEHGVSHSAVHISLRRAGLPTSALALLRAEAGQRRAA